MKANHNRPLISLLHIMLDAVVNIGSSAAFNQITTERKDKMVYLIWL